MCIKAVAKHGWDYFKGLSVGSVGYVISGFPVVAQSTFVPAQLAWLSEVMKIVVALCTAIYLVVKTISIIRNGKEK